VHNLIEELLMMMMQVLTDVELDAVSAGASSARFAVTSALALGPNNATVDVADVDVFAQTVGGLAPSNTGFAAGTVTAAAD
jgi:hypothetical protein